MAQLLLDVLKLARFNPVSLLNFFPGVLNLFLIAFLLLLKIPDAVLDTQLLLLGQLEGFARRRL